MPEIGAKYFANKLNIVAFNKFMVKDDINNSYTIKT